MHRSEERSRERAVARREGRGGVREMLDGIKVVSQEREGMGREVVGKSVVNWRWRVRAVSIFGRWEVVWLGVWLWFRLMMISRATMEWKVVMIVVLLSDLLGAAAAAVNVVSR